MSINRMVASSQMRRAGYRAIILAHMIRKKLGAEEHRCVLGFSFEGIVSKRLGSPYRSGRSRHWIKSKNPKHPAVKREAEEE
jgi:ATP-dependent DNA ligase